MLWLGNNLVNKPRQMQTPTKQHSLALAWKYARAEMRGSVARFRVFLAALMLGVAAIGAVGSVADAMKSGISSNARTLLGGDFELSSLHTAAEEEILAPLENIAKRSDVVQMRAMLNAGDGRRKLVEMKAVDQFWPLTGQAILQTDQTLVSAFADNGVIVDASLLRSLGLEIGDTAQLGKAVVRVSDVIVSEPDSAISFVSFGPRILISAKTLQNTELKRPGSFITYRSRFVMNDPSALNAVTDALTRKLADTHIRIRTMVSAAPGFERFISRAELFLTLVGLTALLIGGLGISGGVRAWISSRMHVIATLKSLGASSAMIFRIYMMQVMALAGLGIGCGLILASLAPIASASIFAQYVNVPLRVGIYPVPLLLAGGFGLLTTLVFALWPLARTRYIKAAFLFRSMLTLPAGKMPLPILISIFFCSIGLLGLAIIATNNIMLALSFMVGTLISLALLGLLGEIVLRGMRQLPAPSYVPARLALSALTRLNSPLRSIIIAFGLGLSVLVAVTLSQANLTRQLNTQAQAQAPDWFFIDIQPDQIDGFTTAVADVDSTTIIEKTPMLRGRVTAINGVSTADITPPEGSEWVMRGDRALTWSPVPPPETEIIRGEWWDADYRGAPLMSVTEEMLSDFGLELGDTVTLNILGREITAAIANTRKVEWESFRINFVFVASPGLLDNAPHSWIATTRSPQPEKAAKIETAIAQNFSNVSAVSVKQAVKTATDVLGLLGGAIQLTALVTLIAGLAVLSGTVASTEAQRLSDAIILKVLGARRKDILIAWMLEYSLLGALTALVASIIGSAASYALISVLIGAEFELDLHVVLLTAGCGAIGTMLLGLAGAARSLAKKPAPYLRETI